MILTLVLARPLWNSAKIRRKVLCVKCTMIVIASVIVAFGVSAQERTSVVLSPANNKKVMLAAVSRDESLLAGGISSSKWTGRGTAIVEPIAYLTSSGAWTSPPCSSESQKSCFTFARDYLSKPHLYTVVSSDGKEAAVHARPASLGECFDYAGTGTYSGASIENSAIAASSTEFFADTQPVKALGKQETLAIRALLSRFVPKKIGSTSDLRVFAVRLEEKEFYVIQRAFADSPEGTEKRTLIFGIGRVISHRFEFVHWKKNIADENERVLGTISLKSGREYLVSVVNHPEGHFFRVYGIRDGHLALVYSGGGASC